jgi:S1-C subfamily serine protease
MTDEDPTDQQPGYGPGSQHDPASETGPETGSPTGPETGSPTGPEFAAETVPNQDPLFPPPWPTAGPSQPTAPPWPPAPALTTPAKKRRAPMIVAMVATVALLAGAAGAAVGVAVSQDSSTSPSTSNFVPPGFDGGSGGTGSSGGSGGSLGNQFGSGSGTSGTNVNIDVNGIATKVSPAIVNIATTLSGGQQAAGTGMVLTSSGEVLTNNHVINGATKIQVEVGVTGKTYSAKVLGYDIKDDVALIKLNNASGMKTISTSSSVSKNDAVVAIGNALGRFGTPAAVAGTVTALHQDVTAGDGLDQESLSDMIRIAASIQPGDSGGALLDANGKVIGMNTAADAGSGRFGYQPGTTGFAIPIGNAIRVVQEIKNGDSSNGAHIGDRALLGVVLQSASSGSPFGNGAGSAGAGAPVADVGSGTPAEAAGLAAGDTITAIGRHQISSVSDLRTFLDTYRPGDKITVTWADSSGAGHHATVTLTKGQPA